MSYDEKYKNGGWHYDRDREALRLKKTILDPLGLKPPGEVLEIGCGMGLHSAILASIGFSVTGIDTSAEGIKAANRQNTSANFVQGDALFAPAFHRNGSLDFILSRGMSWYHYDLSKPDVTNGTAALFKLLKPGGVFALTVRTDFSGALHVDGVLNNKLDAYVNLFEPLGEIVLKTNGIGEPLEDQEHAREVGGDVIIAAKRRRN